MKKYTAFSLLILHLMLVIASCTKDKINANEDLELFEDIMEGGYHYYQNGNRLNGVAPSPHGAFKLRFNEIAFAALDTSGELPVGAKFPDGSLIVKEIYDSNDNLKLYAIMEKEPGNTFAAENWVWAELNADGSVNYSAGNKGAGCKGCHSGTPGRDFIRTFDFH